MKNTVTGIFAHVDAGKTTLAEALLYKSGIMRKLGRVDNGDTLLDTHELEKKRGITIFAGQANFIVNDLKVSLLDTPGHVDFSAETERMMQIIDSAVLVISGTDGVQSHTRTLWKMLGIYNIPVFIFITKMDYARKTEQEIIKELKSELSENCVIFPENENVDEEISLCSEDMLEKYLENGVITDDDKRMLVASRRLFPCFFGSGLKLDGIDYFLSQIYSLSPEKIYPDTFGAKVYKISHDSNGNRLTHLKVTGGTLKVRDILNTGETDEKVNAIRIYSGSKFTTADEITAGEICAVAGLNNTKSGQGLGFEAQSEPPITEPVMNYRIVLPEGADAKLFLPKLRLLEEEDPQLNFTWNSRLQEIHVGLMGEVQTEILKSLVEKNFGLEIEIDQGKVLYKETILEKTEGVGHYEPLRHYAEVHLIMEPLPRGAGLVFETKCREDSLDRNWQRLILTHLYEKQHLGVLTGSPVTDIKITLAAGRAHIKHTEGGDFRQATYRAVRQGLMKTKSVLLEPYYSFRLEVPTEQIGRAINDIRAKYGEFDAPQDMGGMSMLTGTAPVTTLNTYASEVAAYTGGAGRLSLTLCGYGECHNADEIIEQFAYDPEADLDNTPDSVFCAHGGGFAVKWDKVSEYMHIESCLEKKETPYEASVNTRNFSIDDKELEAIMEREFGPAKLTQTLYRPKPQTAKEKPDSYENKNRKKHLIVDGYNVIFAWDELKSISETDLDGARVALMNILSNYAAFTKSEVILVFDAYNVSGNSGKRFDFNNIHVVFTKENETGDTYIEKLSSEIGKNENVRVVTSDNLIRLSALRYGVLRVSSKEFRTEVENAGREISEFLEKLGKSKGTKVKDIIDLK